VLNNELSHLLYVEQNNLFFFQTLLADLRNHHSRTVITPFQVGAIEVLSPGHRLIFQWIHFGVPYPDNHYPLIRYMIGDAVFVKFIRSEGTVITQPVFISRVLVRIFNELFYRRKDFVFNSLSALW